jgi:hypothetical protein
MSRESLSALLHRLHESLFTGSIRLVLNQRQGFLHFLKGELIDAEFENLSGESAALELCGWSNPSVMFEAPLPGRSRTIGEDFQTLMAEARVRHLPRILPYDPTPALPGDETTLSDDDVLLEDSIDVAEVPLGSAQPYGNGQANPPQSASPMPTHSPHPLDAPSVKSLQVKMTSSGQVFHQRNFPKATQERNQYLSHLAALVGREFGLEPLIETRALGHSSNWWFHVGPRLTVYAETSSSVDLEGLASVVDGGERR